MRRLARQFNKMPTTSPPILPHQDVSFPLAGLFHGRLYHAYNDWVKAAHGGRMQKVSLDAGLTCPNRDGSKGRGGCTFCNNQGFTPGYLQDQKDLIQQLETGLSFVKRRYPGTRKFLAYFQTYSNTYGDFDALRDMYARVLAHPEIDGIAVGTRPDCLPDEVLDLLADIAQHYVVELEIGIESCNDVVLERCNRGHDFASTIDALHRAAQRQLFVTGHLLLGLPGETRESVVAGAVELARLPISALKFHQLQIVKGTQLANQFRADPASVPLLDLDTYLQWVVDILERLPPAMRIQRLGSEVPERLRLSAGWNKRIGELPPLLDAALAARATWQGRLYST